uniref:Chromo domain-containing protein n=1 Tax=Steinernema glaseri TaxID=37863 RepID=A0A1I7ZGI6_9BILA
MPRPIKRVLTNEAGEPIVPTNAKKPRKVKPVPKEDDDIYEVEQILDSRQKGQQFLVKWVGYTKRTWEPRANILDYSLIKDFEEFKKWQESTKKLGKRSKLDKNAKVEKIVRSRKVKGVKKLLVKFENSSEYEVHDAKKVFSKHPNLRDEFVDEDDA